jgi:cytochrome c peroxidase
LFTDFTYDNLGVPPVPGGTQGDRGLGAIVHDAAQDGKFRVPTLRNVARTAPYMHNGVFTDLRQVVDFYNTRDVKAWPAPDIASTMNRTELGNLGLTDAEVDDLVAFLLILTDGWE